MDNLKSQNSGWVNILFFIVPYFLIIGLTQYIGILLINVDVNKPLTTFQHFVINLFGLIGFLFFLWFYLKLVDNEQFINIGFNLKKQLRQICFGIIIGLAIMSFSYLYLLKIEEIVYVKMSFNFYDIAQLFGLCIVISLNEEVLFRGYILRNLLQSFNKYIALIVSSIFFSIIHGFNPNMSWVSYVNLFLAGILLGLSYIHTKNLWFSISLHFSWNFFQSLFGFNVSGLNLFSLVEFKIVKFNMINGGNFGFEGSILSVLIQIIFIVVIFYYYKSTEVSK